MSSVVDLLQQLIRIPSVNPDGDPGTDQTGEGRCAQFIADFLTTHGAQAELHEILPGRPNIVARFPSDRPGKPRILFAPHTDTVSVAGMTIDPFAAELRDGRIWGRGASDTKGSIAAMLDALAACKDFIPRLPYEIWFAGLMSEETDQHGSHALAHSEKFDFVMVGEPTDLQIVHTHKGSLRLHLEACGMAAHSSSPQLGKNAIEPVLDALVLIRGEFQRAFGSLTHPILGPATMNIGTIRGGSKVNIVPESCSAWVDFRILPGQPIAEWLEDIKRQCPDVEFTARTASSLYTDPEHALIKTLRSLGARLVGAPWFCDAAPFAEIGTPAIAIGPGSIAQAHRADEWIAVSDLEEGGRFFRQFLNQLKIS